MKKDKPKIHIASCSFGKDSLATILLALENNEPLDRVVFAEVMFDHSRNISGEIPEHIEWVYNTAIPKLESMGVKVDVVRAKKDYKSFFFQCRRRGQYKGKTYGFPIGGMCVINRECKMKPIRDYYKSYKDEGCDIVQYVGIARDEPKRLTRLKNNQVSLLAKYSITEKIAYKMCERAGLLSPIYAKLPQYIRIRRNHSEMWEELRALSLTPNICSYGFKYGKTLQEVEKEMDRIEEINEKQVKLF